MGGGAAHSSTTPIQTPQSTAALGGAMGAAGTASGLSNRFSQQQQQLYNLLYGTPGGGGGAVTPMLNPSNLNVTKPTGVFALQNTNADEAAAKQYEANAGNIKQGAANAGFNPSNTPSGFVQDQLNRNARSLADTRGSNFLGSTTNQYNDALANFWKAAGLTSSGATAAGTGALSGASTAGNVYNNLYGKSMGTYSKGKPSTLSQIQNVGSQGVLGMGGGK